MINHGLTTAVDVNSSLYYDMHLDFRDSLTNSHVLTITFPIVNYTQHSWLLAHTSESVCIYSTILRHRSYSMLKTSAEQKAFVLVLLSGTSRDTNSIRDINSSSTDVTSCYTEDIVNGRERRQRFE